MNLAADLPAPRDDEPADLRRDIVDELADHLHCAVDRERQRAALEGDEAAAQNQDSIWPRVVARFGHPARIARQLWWDAMKEKVMSQRTQTASLVIMALFSLAMLVVTFMSLADSRRLAADNQALNRELLAQLEELANRPVAEPAPALPEANVPSEWNQLQFRCVWGSEDGEPAEGVRILLESESENTAGIPDSDEVTSSDGIADFGKVLYGTYSIYIRTPNHLTSRQSVAVRPGQDRTVTIVCPEGPALASVSLLPQFDWNSVPESLQDRVWVYCSIHVDNSTGLGSGQWNVNYEYEWPAALQENGQAFASGFNMNYDVGSFLINAAGQILPAGQLDRPVDENTAEELSASQLRRVAYMRYELPEEPEYIASVELPPGGYNIYSAIVVSDPADETGRRLLAIDRLPRSDGIAGGFGGGGQTGFDAMRAQMEGRGTPMGGRGWGGSRDRAREGTLPMTTQLGALPASYLAGELPQWSGGYPGSSPYGGSSGSQSTYIVSANGEQDWEFPVDDAETLFLAELALRVPVGTDITPIGVHIPSEYEAAVAPDSVIDLIWKGLMVQPDDSVVLEEHVLLTGLQVIATGGQVEREGIVLKELYVPLMTGEATALLDESIQYGVVARSSSEPPRSAGATPIDSALVERIRSNSVPISGLSIDPATALKVIRVEAHNSGEGDGMMDRGTTCDVVATMALRSGLQRTVPLLHNRIIQKSSYSGEGVNTYEVAIFVTAEEEAVVSQFLGAADVYTQALPQTGPSVTGPFESSPHLESALLELQRWQQQSEQREEEFEQLENLRDDAESEDKPLEDQGTEPIE